MNAEREATAARRVSEALAEGRHSWMRLSDVIYDAAEDGFEQPDGEGDVFTPDHGFDCDDLARVLVPLLMASPLGPDEEVR